MPTKEPPVSATKFTFVEKLRRLKKWQRNCGIGLILLLLYTVVGFFVAPEPLRGLIEEKLSAQSARQVTLNKLELNPFDFSVRLHGFAIQGLAGEQLLGFEQLFVNLSVRHLLVGRLVVEGLMIEKPSVVVLVNEAGELNWQLMVAQLTGGDSEKSPAPAEDEDSSLLAIQVVDFVLAGGQVEFNDFSHATPFNAVLAPLELKLKNFSTQLESDSPYSFHAVLDRGASLRWSGDVGINPLRSTGVFELSNVSARNVWAYIQDQVAFEVYKGVFSFKARYNFDGSGEEPLVQLFEGVYQLQDLTMGYKRASDNMISVPELVLNGIALDTAEKTIRIADLATREGQISSQLKNTGKIDLLGLFESAQDLSDPSEATANEAVEVAAVSADAPQEQPWNFTLEHFSLENYRIDFSDHTVPDAPSWTASPIMLIGGPVEFPQIQPVSLELGLGLDDGSELKVTGDVLFTPQVTLDLAFNKFDLTRLQPYLDANLQLQIQQGKASVEGALGWQGGEDPQLSFDGQFQVDELLTQDKVDYQEFMKWKSLLVEGIAFDQASNRLAIGKITTLEPYARVIIYPDLTVNVSQVLSPPKAANDKIEVAAPVDQSAGSSSDTPPSAPAIQPSNAAAPMAINIDRVVISDGQANFSDLSLKPKFSTGIHMLNGGIEGLGSDPAGRAKVDISGKVDRYAPVKIKGEINPFSAESYTDINLSFANMELTTLTPYSGKFAGYTINKGKLSLELNYLLDKRQLKGENRMVLDQLTLGDRTDSPDATSLPVTMAIALMKDSQGRIDIDLPVAGDLDNPEFSYGSLMATALTNLITNIISSPFRALGSILGDDAESFSQVTFSAGISELSQEGQQRLTTLVEALAQRPSIKLELTGGSNHDFDWPVIARKQLDTELRSLAWQYLKAEGQPLPASPEDLIVSQEIQTVILQQRYRRLYAPDLPAEAVLPADREIISQLVSDIPPQPAVLRQLAQLRADEVRRYLLEESQLEPERLYLLEVDVDAPVENNQVSVSLSLTD